MGNVRKIIKNTRLFFKETVVEGGLLTVILVVSLLLLLSNIFRVISTGKSNFDVYVYEQESLNALKEKNKELSLDKTYYQSEEYKLLSLRDTELMAKPGESIYTTRDKTEYFDQPKALLDVSYKENYADWWVKLFF